jgi:hypothetical protein
MRNPSDDPANRSGRSDRRDLLMHPVMAGSSIFWYRYMLVAGHPSMPLRLAGLRELIRRRPPAAAAGRRRRPTILFQF